MHGIGTAVRHGWVVAVLAAVGGLIGFAPAAGAERVPGPAYLGYNDVFNGYDLRATAVDDPDQSSPILPLPVPLPIPGRESNAARGGQLPPDRRANGAALMARAREGGANVIRYVVPWSRVERDRGKYDWHVEDQTYRLTLEAGLRPLIVLHAAPCWAHGKISCQEAAARGFKSLAPAPRFADSYGRWAAAAIKRYPKAVGFEIWNESNFKPFWGPKPSPGAYVRLLGAVEKETAGLRRHPPILFNGLTPNPTALTYLKRALAKKKAAKLIDGTAVHPYVGAKGVRLVRKRVRRVRKVVRDARAPRPVWITEIGWSTNPEATSGITNAAQASRIERLVRMAPRMRVKSVIVHRLRDVRGLGPWEEGLGVVTTRNQPKPIFCKLGLDYGLKRRPAGC